MNDDEALADLEEDHEQYAGEEVEVDFETGKVTVLPHTVSHVAAMGGMPVQTEDVFVPAPSTDDIVAQIQKWRT
jgi:selenophosphate synthetase-related protein